MEKLFDETNEFESKYYRTVWYGYFNNEFNEEFVKELAGVIKNDMVLNNEADTVEATQWIFYSGSVSEDAIGDKVRSSLMVRNKNNNFIVHYNMSDFEFAAFYDIINGFSQDLRAVLNKIY